MKILPLALSFLNAQARDRLSGVTTTARMMAVIGALATISAIFFLAALTIALATRLGVIGACLAMGGFFAFLTLVMYLQYRRKKRGKDIERVERLAVASSADTAGGAGAMMMAQAFMRGFFGKGR